MEDLKNCPLCNTRPSLEKFPLPFEEVIKGYIWNIYSQCGLQLGGFDDKDELVKKWNTRTESAELLILQERYNAQEKKIADAIEMAERALKWINVRPTIYERECEMLIDKTFLEQALTQLKAKEA